MGNPHSHEKIIFFDGHCILCNGSVDFLIRADRKRIFRFASLQSGFSKTFINQADLLNTDSIVFYDAGRYFLKSSAVLRIMRYLPLPYNLIGIFKIIPRSWRDSIYDLIARKRYHWFGKKDACRVPDNDSRGRIIG